MDDLNMKNNPMLKQFVPAPSRPPRKSERGIIGTIRYRCFNSIGNSLLTLSVVAMLFYVLKHSLDWALFNAVLSQIPVVSVWISVPTARAGRG